jgi:hypothetical protein
MIEALNDKPLLHAVIGALVLEGIGFAQQKKLGKKCIIEHSSQVDIASLLE